jgi:hypothetical protein
MPDYNVTGMDDKSFVIDRGDGKSMTVARGALSKEMDQQISDKYNAQNAGPLLSLFPAQQITAATPLPDIPVMATTPTPDLFAPPEAAPTAPAVPMAPAPAVAQASDYALPPPVSQQIAMPTATIGGKPVNPMNGAVLGGTTTVTGPSSQTQTKSYSPEEKKALLDAQGKFAAAYQDKVATESMVAQQQMANETAIAAKDVELRNQILENEKQRLARVQTAQNEYNQAWKQYSGATVDANRLWHDSSTGQKVAAGIGIILGSVGQVMSKGNTNVALDAINRVIDNDIAAQKFNIQKMGEGVNMQGNKIAALRAQLGDERLADLAYKEAALDNVKTQLNQAMLGTKNKQIQANAQTAISEVQKQQALLNAEASAQVTTQASGSTSESIETTNRQGLFHNPLGTVEGFSNAQNEDSAKTFRTKYETIKNGRDTLKAFSDTIDRLGTIRLWGTKEKGELEAAQTEAKNVIKQLSGVNGTMTEPEAERSQKQIGGIKTPDQVRGFLKPLLENLDRQQATLQMTTGVKPLTSQSRPSSFEPIKGSKR